MPRTVLETVILLTAVTLTGCSGVPLDTRAPAGFDLSGRWRLVDAVSDPAPERRPLRRRGFSLAFAAADFPVLEARTLSIEQNRDSMGVNYDGDNYRDVSWGERQRGLWEVNAGWLDGVLLIRSEAPDAEATERLRLEGDRLVVDVEVSSGGETLTRTRVFERR